MRFCHLLLAALLVAAAVIGVQLVVTNFENRSYQEVDENGGPPGVGTFIHADQRRPVQTDKY